jgi:hypothetical protein
MKGGSFFTIDQAKIEKYQWAYNQEDDTKRAISIQWQ